MIQRDNPAPGNIKQVSQDELESFKKVRHIPMGDKFIPVLNVEVPLGNINNMPVVTGVFGGTEDKTLRDTGYSAVIIRENLVPEN